MTKVFNTTLTTDVQTVSLIGCQETKVDVENVDDFQRVWMRRTYSTTGIKRCGKITQTKSSPTIHEPDLILILWLELIFKF